MAGKNSKSSASISTSSLIQGIMEQFQDLPRKLTKELLTSFLHEIESNVAAGRKVRIDKLGILCVKDRKPRTGRNPTTGESIHIPASKAVVFRVSSTLKEKIGIKKKTPAAKVKTIVKKKK